MNIHQEAMRIVFRAQEGTAPTKAECAFLLDLPEASFEAGILKAAADAISREKFGNRGILLGQIGVEMGCFQHAAMRRVYVPSSPLAHLGQITERRLAQVVAVVALATLNVPETRSIAVHEPNLLGLAAGANTVYAETGSNPRDTAAETSGHRGLDMPGCRKMAYEAGFGSVLLGDQTSRPLTHISAGE